MRLISKNGRLISELREEVRSKPELAAQLDVSSQTIYRKMRQLNEFGLATRTPDGYRLTEIGEFHARRFVALCDASETVFEVGEVLYEIPGDDLPEIEEFAVAEVTPCRRHAPDAPVEQVTQFISGAQSLRVLLPVFRRGYVDAMAERSDLGTIPVVLEDHAGDRSNGAVERKLDELVSIDAVRVTRTDSRIPVGLFLDEAAKRVAITAIGERGNVAGAIVSSSSSVYDWAEATYDSYDGQVDNTSDAVRPTARDSPV
ncbi:HTH domain-containing protein [Halorussus limi]|uniref:HTH domain-containing protein n=1 Tax=Halorussus limi TaxID=2938695 RepID=A0A8U0HVK4_9EURY|nr:HTH domain-containing protein [Halorussus limi]UPV74741.1 HTH domain-containing protein [Halorussus limi]